MIGEELVGTVVVDVTFPVDLSKAAELARAFADPDPIWQDRAAAAEAGFDAVPTMPTVNALETHWLQGGVLGTLEKIGIDPQRALHGESSYEYFAPVRVGDVLTLRQVVTDVSQRQGRRGGAMTLITLESNYVNQDGVHVQRRTDKMIERSSHE